MSTPEDPTPAQAPAPGGQPAPTRPRRFVRTRRGRAIGGVCSGLGEQLGVDPLLLRIAFVGLAFFAGAGIWLYLAILLLTPEEGAAHAPVRALLSSWQTLVGVVLVIVALAALASVLGHDLPQHVLRGFWVGVGAIVLVGVVAALAWSWLRRRTRGSADLRLAATLALLVAWGATLLLAAVAGGVLAGTERHAAAWAVIALGVALLASAFTRLRLLVLPVAAFVLPVVVFAAAGVDLHGGVGERLYVPRSLSALRRSYELGVGRLEVDLRDVRFPAGRTRLHVRLGLGELVVVVPESVCVLEDAHVAGGVVGSFERVTGGLEVNRRFQPTPPANASVLVIEGKVGLGAVFVANRPLEGRFQAGAYGTDSACFAGGGLGA